MKNEVSKPGVFVISLDLELLWGVWDVVNKNGPYGENILGVKKVIPRLLELFSKYQVNATFATVGFLFTKNKQELLSSLPQQKPSYSNPGYNVYLKEIPRIGNDESEDPYHFGYSLLEMIKKSGHEIGTHTFSHYYCLEDGQTLKEFEADIKAAKYVAEQNRIELKSFIFPRNQVNEKYLNVLKNNGLITYRGNPSSWIYKPRKFASEGLLIRLCRLIDSYVSISGMNVHSLSIQKNGLVNIPASRFMKPYFKPFGLFEQLRLHRIKQEMTYAAKNNKLYHLWWHPHNFGKDLDRNIHNLRLLLEHYQKLNKEFGFSSLTMQDTAARIANTNQ